MKIERLHLAYFDPELCTRWFLMNIALGMQWNRLPVREQHLAAQNKNLETSFGPNDLLVLGTVVHADGSRSLRHSELNRLVGRGTPFVPIVVHEDAGYGDTLEEMAGYIRARGFQQIASAAFTETNLRRPKPIDLKAAYSFGRRLALRLVEYVPAIDIGQSKITP